MPSNEFPPHVRLMLVACGEPAPADLGSAIAAVERWEDFLAVTIHHRLVPRVLTSLRAADNVLIPLSVRFALERKDTANRVHLARMLSEFERIQQYFATQGFPLAVLKGVPLAALSAGDATARHIGDLDLLTSDQDLFGQMRLMQDLGYTEREPRVRLTRRRLDVYRHYWKGLEFHHPQLGTSVDLHWRLFHNRLHPANALDRFAPVLVQGLEVSSHSLEDQLLYLAAHGAWDEWVYLKGLADVAACLRRMSAAELDDALARARKLGLLRQVSSAVWLAREWMGSTAESRLLLHEEESFHESMRRRVLAQLAVAEYRPKRVARSWVSAVRLELALVPGFASGVQILKRYLWRPRTWDLLDLPDELFWLTPVIGAVRPPRVRHDGKRTPPPRT